VKKAGVRRRYRQECLEVLSYKRLSQLPSFGQIMDEPVMRVVVRVKYDRIKEGEIKY